MGNKESRRDRKRREQRNRELEVVRREEARRNVAKLADTPNKPLTMEEALRPFTKDEIHEPNYRKAESTTVSFNRAGPTAKGGHIPPILPKRQLPESASLMEKERLAAQALLDGDTIGIVNREKPTNPSPVGERIDNSDLRKLLGQAIAKNRSAPAPAPREKVKLVGHINDLRVVRGSSKEQEQKLSVWQRLGNWFKTVFGRDCQGNTIKW